MSTWALSYMHFSTLSKLIRGYLENIVENLKAAHNLFTSCYVSYKIANSTWGLSPWQWWWFGHHHVHVVVVVIQQRGVWLDVTWAQTSCWTLQQQLLLLNSINNNAINCHYFKLILKTDKLLCFKVVCPLGRYASVGRKSNLLRGICSCYKLFQWTLIEIATAPFLREISNIERVLSTVLIRCQKRSRMGQKIMGAIGSLINP